MSTILPHMMRPLCEFRMHVWNVQHMARWKYRTQKVAINAPCHNFVGLYLCNNGMYRRSEKKLVKQQYLLHMSSQYGELWSLTAETGWRVWDTSANFNRFCILASLLQRCHSTVVNQTLHMFGHLLALAPTEFCQMQNSLCVQVLTSILAALLNGTRAVARWHHVGHQPTF